MPVTLGALPGTLDDSARPTDRPGSGTLDLRCQLHDSWRLDHPQLPAGECAYHIVLSGECQLQLADGQSQRLCAGQSLLLPHGARHSLSHGTGTPGALRQDRFGALPRVRIGRGESGLDRLYGHFCHAPASTLFAALPERVLPVLEPDSSLDALVALLRREAENQQEGARSVIDQLSGARFSLILRSYLAQHPPTPRCAGATRRAAPGQGLAGHAG